MKKTAQYESSPNFPQIGQKEFDAQKQCECGILVETCFLRDITPAMRCNLLNRDDLETIKVKMI